MGKFFYFIDRLQTVSASPTPHERTLDQNIKNLEEFLPLAKETHLKYYTEEKDEETKLAAKTEFYGRMDEAEAALASAKDKQETLIAASEVLVGTITEEQEKNVANKRVKTV